MAVSEADLGEGYMALIVHSRRLASTSPCGSLSVAESPGTKRYPTIERGLGFSCSLAAAP